MDHPRLSFELTLKDAVTTGLKNLPSILGCVVLWLLTIWIPYINVGTTIALGALPIELSKGNVINPTSIFDAKYRRYMGECFLLYGLTLLGIILGLIFFIVPGIVISIAWSLAILFVIDKGMNPMEALTQSNKATFGSKWAIFGAYLIIIAPVLVLRFALFDLTGVPSSFLAGIVYLVVAIITQIFNVAMMASVYRQLVLERNKE